ncbi:MAG: hemerythrin domain-containing protein [Chloroflexi bacterium]|nr:hemerythrin domain-containing protein [Chloroflexota bacterium]
MVGQILDPSKELQEDHRQARDGLLDLLKACQERDLKKAREIVAFIDAVAGPHWRWEEEGLYPALRQLSEDLAHSLLREHDEVIEGVARLTELFKRRGVSRYAPTDWAEAAGLVPRLLYHVATCDGLVIMMEKLGEDELFSLRQAIFLARHQGLTLLEWARQRRETTLLQWEEAHRRQTA